MLNTPRQVLFKTIAIGEGDCLPISQGPVGMYSWQVGLGNRWDNTKSSLAGCPGGGRWSGLYPKGRGFLEKPTSRDSLLQLGSTHWSGDLLRKRVHWSLTGFDQGGSLHQRESAWQYVSSLRILFTVLCSDVLHEQHGSHPTEGSRSPQGQWLDQTPISILLFGGSECPGDRDWIQYRTQFEIIATANAKITAWEKPKWVFEFPSHLCVS